LGLRGVLDPDLLEDHAPAGFVRFERERGRDARERGLELAALGVEEKSALELRLGVRRIADHDLVQLLERLAGTVEIRQEERELQARLVVVGVELDRARVVLGRTLAFARPPAEIPAPPVERG